MTELQQSAGLNNNFGDVSLLPRYAPDNLLASNDPRIQAAVQRVNATADALSQEEMSVQPNNGVLNGGAQAPAAHAVAAPTAPRPPTAAGASDPVSDDPLNIYSDSHLSSTDDPLGIYKTSPASEDVSATSKQSTLQSELGQVQDLATGASIGWGPRIGEDIATALEYAGGVLTPGKGRDLADINAQNEEIRHRLFAPQENFNSEHPIVGGILQGAGMLTSGGALAKLAGAALPTGAENALIKFSTTNPYLAAAGVAGGTGGFYAAGTTEGTPEERAASATVNSGAGLLAGPALRALAKNVVAPVASKVGGALGSLVNRFTSPSIEGTLASATQKINIPQGTAQTSPPTFPIASGLPDDQVGATIAAPTGELPLSEGQKTGNSNLLRIEEKARQGEMGHDLEQQVKSSDLAVSDKAKSIVEYLRGNPQASGNDLLASTIDDFRDAGNAAKSEAQGLYAQRDAALKGAVAIKQKVGFSLGTDLDGLMQDEKYSFAAKANAQAADLYQQYKDMMTSPGKELPMGQYTAWRKNISDVALANQGNQNGYLAGKMGSIADDWMENKLTPNMISEGDPNIGKLINDAKSAWARYKSLYSPETFRGKSSVISDITNQYDKTPQDFVQSVFGTSGYGTNATSSIVRNIQKGLPQGAMQQKFADNVFSGLLDRVFDKSNKSGTINLGSLGDGLTALQKSNVYKTTLLSPERDKIITNLISDINDYTAALNDRTVRSPSGGYIMRGVQAITELPGVNKIPIAGRVSEMIGNAQEAQQNLQDKLLLNKTLSDAADHLKGKSSTGKMFDPMTMGILGGEITGYSSDRTLKEDTNQQQGEIK